MREYELEVLEHYDMEVRGTRRIRGAFFCETDEGTMLLKETRISERRASLLYTVLDRLEKEDGLKVDTPVFTRDHELLVISRDGTKYMMKKWFSGRECEVRKENDLILAAQTLARLHLKLNESRAGESVSDPPVHRNPLDELLRHNREMKKVRTFIRSRVTKNEFEYLYLESFEKMYALADRVFAVMRGSGCMDLYDRSLAERNMSHGDYNYHNVQILAGDTAITNFEHMCVDIQVKDLYYFLRKTMEKYHWKQKTGQNIMEAYENIRSLTPAERKFVGLSLAYPEKYWKTASGYYHSNKAWLQEKSVEKLRTAIRQSEEKYTFLEDVFSLKIL